MTLIGPGLYGPSFAEQIIEVLIPQGNAAPAGGSLVPAHPDEQGLHQFTGAPATCEQCNSRSATPRSKAPQDIFALKLMMLSPKRAQMASRSSFVSVGFVRTNAL
jgi:hypothetical protein